jgi:uncharacterized metal-binding protein YceD (DUF177 family)
VTPSPLQQFYDLADLSEAGAEVVVSAKPADLPALAKWAGVDAVERFEGRVLLRKLPAHRFVYDASLTADVVQSCVVTLEPVRSHLERNVSRTLHLSQTSRRSAEPEPAWSPADDEGPEEIQSPRYDLAAPLLEEFVLSIDPYPRAPGVAFEPPADRVEPAESPFAALKVLKKPG